MMEFLFAFKQDALVLSSIGLDGFFEWFKGQAQIVLFIIAIIVLISAVIKRAWIMAVGAIIGLAVIGIFVVNPESLVSLAEWLADMLSIGRGG